MFDVAIIGLGPAGLEALKIAVKNDLKVIAFEKCSLGGTCLNQGCIPTKAILHSANLYKEILNSEEFGISTQDVKFDWNKILDRKNQIVQKFNKALALEFKKKAQVVSASANLIIENDEILIEAEDNIYQAKNIIIATGSMPIELKGLEFDHNNILSSDDVLNLEKLPKSIAVVGSGAIGLEIAQFLNSFNVEVTTIEKAPVLAPNLDIDLQKRVDRILKTNKIKYFKDDFIKSFKNGLVELNSGSSFEAEKVLVAVGRKPILPKVSLAQSEIVANLQINDDCTCDFDNLYIIGDATKKTMLAHNASYQAKIVMNKILGKRNLNQKNCPAVVYLTPEIATVGLKEQDIQNKDEYEIKKMLLGSIAKSWCEGAQDGLIKVILKDNKIKGAHLVSKNASILISIFNILIEKEVEIDEIEEMIFPHPCFSEVVAEVLR